ncbi:hypothetical protein, partial [Streptomyces sp. NPDC088730]|uniref:hypothetical protein n=1 Tax=Streptomyces sp. NPDC088730 TaxID=3365877 RepID=UPI0038245C20
PEAGQHTSRGPSKAACWAVRRPLKIVYGTALRGHPVANLILAFLAIYVLGGVIMTLTGATVVRAWVTFLPVLLAVGAGIAAVRFRRREH